MHNEDSYEARTVTSRSKPRDMRWFAYKIAPKKEKLRIILHDVVWPVLFVLSIALVVGCAVHACNVRTRTYFVSYNYSVNDDAGRTTAFGSGNITIPNPRVTDKNFDEFREKATKIAAMRYGAYSDTEITIISFQELP